MENKTGLQWHIVEAAIIKEIKWLEDVIHTPHLSDKKSGFLPDKERYNDFMMLRKIAQLIVLGTIRAKKLKAISGKDLWSGLTKEQLQRKARHGKEWHQRMMDALEVYFKKNGYEVTSEPILNFGRADLGVYKDSETPIYVEVGTTSVDKLYLNLASMPNATILLVPSEAIAIEFQTSDKKLINI